MTIKQLMVASAIGTVAFGVMVHRLQRREPTVGKRIEIASAKEAISAKRAGRRPYFSLQKGREARSVDRRQARS